MCGPRCGRLERANSLEIRLCEGDWLHVLGPAGAVQRLLAGKDANCWRAGCGQTSLVPDIWGRLQLMACGS